MCPGHRTEALFMCCLGRGSYLKAPVLAVNHLLCQISTTLPNLDMFQVPLQTDSFLGSHSEFFFRLTLWPSLFIPVAHASIWAFSSVAWTSCLPLLFSPH